MPQEEKVTSRFNVLDFHGHRFSYTLHFQKREKKIPTSRSRS